MLRPWSSVIPRVLSQEFRAHRCSGIFLLMAPNQHDLIYIKCVCVCVCVCVCTHPLKGKVLRLIHGMNFFIRVEWSARDTDCTAGR